MPSYPTKIKVHEKALAHLSRGLYRSPASAVRELISNGWDANATNVYIDTNYPNFYQLSISDDGDGFSKAEFERLMAGNIGNSQKRPLDKKLINNRPTIGRLGIGMLGIAQICGSFTVTSKPKKGTPFCARIHLYDFLKERLDKDDPAFVKESKDASNEKVVEIDVGEYEYIEFDEESVDQGTTIVTENVHPQFTQSFVETLPAKLGAPDKNWKKAIGEISKIHSLQELGDYWRFAWELSACCPIPYIAGDAIPMGLVQADNKRLEDYDFSVHLDGVVLAKPIYLKDNPAGYTYRDIPAQTKVIYGRKLSFHGYILVQEGLQIHPDELRGIMIRIKDVAIGYYDPTLLDYRYNEGPRSRWFTGEIYISEGLEDALNIDRDSFNKFHPQYRAVQKHVHEILQNGMFTEVYQNIKKRSLAKLKQKTNARKAHVEEVIKSNVSEDTYLRFNKTNSVKAKVSAASAGHIASVVAPDPESLDTKKSNRLLAASILTIFETAMQEARLESRREKFTAMLLELLKKW